MRIDHIQRNQLCTFYVKGKQTDNTMRNTVQTYPNIDEDQAVDFAIVPLVNFYVTMTDIPIFEIQGKPIDEVDLLNSFELWYKLFGLHQDKKFTLIGFRCTNQIQWLKKLFGHHHFEYYFNSTFRDIESLAVLSNDLSLLRHTEYKFHRTDLDALGQATNHSVHMNDSASFIAYSIFEIYRDMLTNFF